MQQDSDKEAVHDIAGADLSRHQGAARWRDQHKHTSVGCRAIARMPGCVVLCRGKLPLSVKEPMVSGEAVPSGTARLRRPDDSFALVCVSRDVAQGALVQGRRGRVQSQLSGSSRTWTDESAGMAAPSSLLPAMPLATGWQHRP